MKKLITTIAGLLLLWGSYEGKAQTCIINQNITTSSVPSCGPATTTFSLSGSQTGVDYFVVTALDADTVSGPFSGTGNSITLSTGLLSSTMRFFVNAVKEGHALNFNGTNGQQVNMPVAAGNFNISNFTVEAWIKTSSSKSNMVIAGSCALGAPYWTFGIVNGKLSFVTNSASTTFTGVSSTALVNDGKWHHVAAVRNATSCSVYIDAVQAGTANVTAMDVSNGSLLVIGGSNCSPTLSFDGSIDEVQLWSVERTDLDFGNSMYACVTSATGLQAAYTFEEGTGTGVSDYLNNYPGTMVNGPTWVTGAQRRATMNDSWLQVIKDVPSAEVLHSGVASFCAHDSLKLLAKADSNVVKFNGVDQYIELYDHITNLSNDNFTLELWLKTTGTSEGILLCSNGNNTWESGERSLYIDANGYPTFVGNGNNFVYAAQSVNDGLWHHVALTWDDYNEVAYIYIDGEDQTDSYNYQSNNSDVGHFTLGQPNLNESTNYFSGLMKQLRIWNTARTQDEVMEAMYMDSIDVNSSYLQASFELYNQSSPTSYYDVTNNYYGSLVNGVSWASESVVSAWNGVSNASTKFYAKTERNYNVTIHSQLSGCSTTSADTLITVDLPTLTMQATSTCVTDGVPVTLTANSNALPPFTIDQSIKTVGYYDIATPTSRIGQSFTAGMSGPLTGITIKVNSIAPGGFGDYTLEIFDGAGFGGTSLFVHNFTGMPSEITTLPVTGVNVVSGNQYTWSIYATGITTQVYISEANAASYAGGNAYYGSGLASAGNASTGSDMYFDTRITPPLAYSWNQGISNGVAFVPTVTKRYTVSVTNVNGCVVKDSISIRVNDCLASGVTKADAVAATKAYPNPGTGVFTVSSSYAEATIQVYNSLGEIVYKDQLHSGTAVLNLSTLENGIYTLKTIHSEGVSTAQLMIER